MKFKVKFEFCLRDLWVGAFWRRTEEHWVSQAADGKIPVHQDSRLDIWVCLVPCFPLHVRVRWGFRQELQPYVGGHMTIRHPAWRDTSAGAGDNP